MYRVPVLHRKASTACLKNSHSDGVAKAEVEEQVWRYSNDYDLRVYTGLATFHRYKIQVEVVKM
jgi:hypothetical protein